MMNNASISTQVHRNFNKSNFDNISIALNKINWCNQFSCVNVDIAATNFYEKCKAHAEYKNNPSQTSYL